MSFQYIAIEGPIGVGKTSLAERLATRLDAALVLEETDNPFLADFYAGRAGAALQSQLFISFKLRVNFFLLVFLPTLNLPFLVLSLK